MSGKTANDWYRQAILYVVYPDSFREGKRADLYTLSNHLEYIKSLGVNAVHILPFLDSPMLDAGFDVRDYTKVRESLGGKNALNKLVSTAEKLNLQLFMDLVVNHVSKQHEWYKKAVGGEEKYRNYFIHSTKEPKLLGLDNNNSGTWAKYQLGRRKLRSRVIFAENGSKLPHWIRGEDGNWYYHTFYAHQIDLNWTNPDVHQEFGDVIKHWASKGFNFRVDAVPYVGKSLTGIMKESGSQSHEVVRSLHEEAQKINKDCVFLLEACQPISKIKLYFGQEGSNESELAYNFALMQAMWAAITQEKSGYIWKAMKRTMNVPSHAQWVTFLRNHDELSLEYASPEVRKLIYQSLMDRSLPFRGEFGVAGRTASFLKGNVKRIKMVHLLLASLPGLPAVIYGDEYGKLTNKRYVKIDTRDSNRGKLTERELARRRANDIRSDMANIFQARAELGQIIARYPTRVYPQVRGVFMAEYTNEDKTLLVVINLTRHKKKIARQKAQEEIITINGGKVVNGHIVLPAYAGVWI